MWQGCPRTEPRCFVASDDEPPRPKPRSHLVVLFLGLVGSALLLPMLPVAGSALMCLFTLGLAAHFGLRREPSAKRERRSLVVGESWVAFESGRPGSYEPLLRLDRPYGLTLLCDPGQNRLVLAITSAERTLYVATTLSPLDEGQLTALSSKACTVPDDDPVLVALGPDGLPLELPLPAFIEFRKILADRDGRAAQRFILSAANGQEVVLEGSELRIGSQRLDLQAPLEWRALWFQERLTHHTLGASDNDAHAITDGACAVYQGTWIKQGAIEAVLVALAPFPSASFRRSVLASGDWDALPPARARDLRLMQAKPEAPPPRELRVGIERQYMLPLRIALERAPRARQMDFASPPRG